MGTYHITLPTEESSYKAQEILGDAGIVNQAQFPFRSKSILILDGECYSDDYSSAEGHHKDIKKIYFDEIKLLCTTT